MTSNTEFPYLVSYEPSNFLTKKVNLFKNAQEYLNTNINCRIHFVALGSTAIKYATTLFGAKHEYILAFVGYDEYNNFRKRRLFGSREYYQAEFILIEFSKLRTGKGSKKDKVGMINLTTFTVAIREKEEFHEGFARRARKCGLHLDDYNYQANYLPFTVGDMLLMAGALASAGYDLVNNNCRHFARSLYFSLSTGTPMQVEDDEQKCLRVIARFLDVHGSATSAQSLLSASYAATQALRLLTVAVAVATTEGIELAFELATDDILWKFIHDVAE